MKIKFKVATRSSVLVALCPSISQNIVEASKPVTLHKNKTDCFVCKVSPISDRRNQWLRNWYFQSRYSVQCVSCHICCIFPTHPDLFIVFLHWVAYHHFSLTDTTSPIPLVFLSSVCSSFDHNQSMSESNCFSTSADDDDMEPHPPHPSPPVPI